MYVAYQWTTFLRLDVDGTVFDRTVMVLGPTPVALAFLISPAVFAAALDGFDPLAHESPRSRIQPWALLVLFALAAFLLSALGPAIAVSLLPGIEDAPPPGAPAAPESVLQVARFMIPVAMAILSIISGIAGALVGHATRHWRLRRRDVTGWFACLALMASFLFPLLGAVNAILHHGASPLWVLVGPLALPLTVTAILAWRERHTLGVPIPWSRTAPHSVDADSLDRIVASLVEDPESAVEGVARTAPEVEMAQLAAAIRRIAAPRTTISESRAAEIVATVLEVSPPAPKASRPRYPRARPGSVGGFCTSWTCIAAGLVIVSPLGGVPISVVSAVAVGLLGSAGMVMFSRRWPELSATVAL